MKKTFSRLFCLALCSVFMVGYTQTINIENPNGKLAPPQLGVSPPQIDQSLRLGGGNALNQSVVFYNYNPKPKQITVQLIDTNRSRRAIKPNKKTLSPWTLLNPTSFTIPGNGQQTIRLSVRPPVGFPKKTHYAVLQIQQQVKESIKKDEEGIVLKFGSSYALPVTIRVK